MSEHQIGDQPIEPHLKGTLLELARLIDLLLNPIGKLNGFILIAFPFEGREGRANYISNCDRSDVVILLKEQLARFEGQPEMKGQG